MFTLSIKTKGNPKTLKGLPFARMKDAILGKKYDLSLVFVDGREGRKLNKLYRKKDYATDILSFPLSKTEGEIVINQKAADKKAKTFDREPINYLQFLFIHGCVHLKGYAHGSRMESEERKFRKKFKI